MWNRKIQADAANNFLNYEEMDNRETSNAFSSSTSCSLLSSLNFNPWLFRPPDGDWELQFVVYQLFRMFKELSTNELFSVGSLNLKNLHISESLWISVAEEYQTALFATSQLDNNLLNAEKANIGNLCNPPSYDVISHLASRTFQSVCTDWLFHRVSNFEYILYLNLMAGRSWSDPNYYPIMPWVTDFSVENGGYVDLSKTKFRQTKGDAALDSTFTLISSGSTPPHHVPSLLTDLTYYLYKARRFDKEILCRFVRKRWVPSEYPSSMKRIQEWSPEECIPDFYCDPVIFKSIHDDLPDIAYPNWCNSPEDFIRYHRSMLESSTVSASLHRWIDLTFGCKLSGAAAVTEKNVHLYLVDVAGKVSHRSGIVQLFTSPHPPRFESVAGQRADFGNQSPTAMLDFTEKLAEFLAEVAPDSAIDSVFDQYLHTFLDSRWDFPDTKRLLTAIAVLIVEISLFHTSSAEIAAANCISDQEKCFQSRLQLATNLYLRCRDNSETFLTPFKSYLDDVLVGNLTNEEDSRLDLHRLDPLSSIGAVLSQGIYFPTYFSSIYSCLVDIHSLHNCEADPVELMKTVMEFLSFSQNDLPYAIAPSFYKLFSDLFTWSDTQSLAVFCLLQSFGTILGRENTAKFLLKSLKQVMGHITDPTAISQTQKQQCLKIFHRDFEMKLVNLFGLQVFLDSVVPYLVRGTVFMSEGVEIGTLGWAIDFVGPIHAARCVIPVIFASLSSCYDDIPNSLNEQISACQECPFPALHCVGDCKADRLGTVLCEAACTYGELLITGQYMSCTAEIIQQAFSSQGSLLQQTESSLLGVLYVLRQLVFIMPGTLLNSQVQERLSRLLTQVVTQITSLHVAFPRAPRSRHLALCRYLDLVYAIGLRLGRLNTEQLLEPLLRLTLIKLSVSFRASMPSTSDDSPIQETEAEIEQRLPSESLHLAYSVFSRIVSRHFLESITSMGPPLPALQLNELPDLCSSASRDRQLFSLGNSFGSAGSNRLSQESLKIMNFNSSFDSSFGEIDQSFRLWERKSRHLANQWAALWAQRLAAPRDYSLRGLHLQSFSGQGPQTKGAVQHLVVSAASEQVALSISYGSGRERAVAVWSLESRSDFSLTPPVLLYPEHKRRCIGLTLLDAHRQILSVDPTTLHLWDPAVGRPVSLISCPAAVASLPSSTYTSSFSSPQWSAVASLGDSGQLAVVSTAFGLVFIADPRLPTAIATAFRSPPLPSGSTSILSSNSDASLIAIGSSSSYVSVLCPRTGRLVAATRAYDSDLAKMSFVNRNHLLTANQDRVLSLWSVNDAAPANLPLSFEPLLVENFTSVLSLVGHFRASLSDNPVALLPGPQWPLIVAATSDRLQYYSSGLDPRSVCQDFNFSRLEQLRGKTITAATVIPSSGFLLLGTDVGSLHLIA